MEKEGVALTPVLEDCPRCRGKGDLYFRNKLRKLCALCEGAKKVLAEVARIYVIATNGI